MKGFQRTHGQSDQSIALYAVKGWDYPVLLKVYADAGTLARSEHLPSLIHVQEMTQPQGHSTSGSHERYKSKDRLAWESEYDCIARMRTWAVAEGMASAKALDALEAEVKAQAQAARKAAWDAYVADNKKVQDEVLRHLKSLTIPSAQLSKFQSELSAQASPLKSNAMRVARRALYATRKQDNKARAAFSQWVQKKQSEYATQYNSHLYSRSASSALKATEIAPTFDAEPKQVDGHEILCACFDAILAREPRFFAIGEDVGKIGDVNQGMAGLQKKYGHLRVDDTGIREASIIGQGIGAAMRGLRPLVEIQYLDYMLFALQTLSDDLCTLRYRSAGGQQAPLIVRTRGHRLEGIWHSGSPMGMLIHGLRGMYVLVPRNMTRAAAFYNVLLKSDDPALVIERLNAYRIKEALPNNLADISYPIGQAEILRPGNDITCLTYGAMCAIVLDAAEQLQSYDISVEVIDAQSLVPFDRTDVVCQSLARTHRLLVADEDVPGGASAYLLQQVIERQQGYYELDAMPRTLTAKAHRPAYGTDGDYFSKPNAEDAFEAMYALMHESNPKRYPPLYP